MCILHLDLQLMICKGLLATLSLTGDAEQNKQFVFQDDIIISYDEFMELGRDFSEADLQFLPRARRNAGSGAEPVDMPSPPKVYNKLWPNCRVPYEFHPDLGKSAACS